MLRSSRTRLDFSPNTIEGLTSICPYFLKTLYPADPVSELEEVLESIRIGSFPEGKDEQGNEVTLPDLNRFKIDEKRTGEARRKLRANLPDLIYKGTGKEGTLYVLTDAKDAYACFETSRILRGTEKSSFGERVMDAISEYEIKLRDSWVLLTQVSPSTRGFPERKDSLGRGVMYLSEKNSVAVLSLALLTQKFMERQYKNK